MSSFVTTLYFIKNDTTMRYIFFIALLLWQNASSAQTLNFKDALAEGKVLVTVKSQGGHTGKCISVHFERLTDKPLRVKIPAGHIFECVDSAYQNIVVVKSEEFTLNNKKQFIKVEGLCCEASNGSPFQNAVYQIGQLATGNLLKMAEFISDKQLWTVGDAQTAIWCMTDSIQPAGISHPALQGMACQLLGVPIPEYKMKYTASTTGSASSASTGSATNASTVRRATPRPVLEKKPLSVEGDFSYYTKEDTEISVLVKNEAGDTVRTIFDHQKQSIGMAKYSFYFKTSKLPPGNYEVILYAGDVAKKKIKVKY
jgi:hypothetical protein